MGDSPRETSVRSMITGKDGDARNGKPKKRRSASGIMRRILLTLGMIYIAWCLLLFFVQDRLFFARQFAPDPTDHLYDARTIELTRDIGNGEHVVAWFIPAPGADASHPAPLMVYVHGNAEIIDRQRFFVEGFQRLGMAVLLPEYRGFGRAGGKPGEQALLDDAEYFLNEVLKRPDVDASRVVYDGRSLGGGVVAGLARRRVPKALILTTTFTSAEDMTKRFGAPTFLARTHFPVLDVVRNLDIPILIFHGTEDGVIPVEQAHKLRDAAKKGHYVEFPHAGHRSFPGEEYANRFWTELNNFLRTNGIVES